MKENPKSKFKLTRPWPLWIKISVLLFVAFLVALWFASGWLKTDLRKWQGDSEAYVLGRIYQMQIGMPNDAGLLLLTANIEDAFLNDEPIVSPVIYWHNIGLHGTILGWVNRGLCLLGFLPVERLRVFYVLEIWAFFIMFGAICYWIWREFGVLAVGFCALGTILSPWTQNTIGNYFWVTALYFLPFVLAAFLCRRYEKVDRVPLGVCALISVGCLIRFLTGFEFASTILICMEVPIIYYWAKYPEQSRKWLYTALKVGAFGLLMFVVALLIWMAKLTVEFGGFARALQEMLSPVISRTGLVVGDIKATGIFAESLEASPLELIRVYLNDSAMLGTFTMLDLLKLYAVIVVPTIVMCVVRHDKIHFSGICNLLRCVLWRFLGQSLGLFWRVVMLRFIHILYIFYGCFL